MKGKGGEIMDVKEGSWVCTHSSWRVGSLEIGFLIRRRPLTRRVRAQAKSWELRSTVSESPNGRKGGKGNTEGRDGRHVWLKDTMHLSRSIFVTFLLLLLKCRKQLRRG